MEKEDVKYIVSENMKKNINNDPEEPDTDWFYVSTNHEPFKENAKPPAWSNQQLKEALDEFAFVSIKEIVLATLAGNYSIVQIRGEKEEIIKEMNS